MVVLLDPPLRGRSKEIIDAADRYGVVSLKLEAEACLVENTSFTIDNAMEHLLYAYPTSCAFLKDVVLDFMVENEAEVSDKVCFANSPGDLNKDVFAAVARSKKRVGTADNGDNQFATLRISELHQRAHEKGLDVDGSREMHIVSIVKTIAI